MASKRMFSSVVVGDDKFRLMSAEAQLLYYTLCMEADDYGIVGSPVSLARAINVSVEAITELEDNEFVLVINRLVVIRHWNVNNTLRDDRLTPTNYPDVLDEIEQDKNGVYWIKGSVPADVLAIRGQMSAKCGQMTDNCQASDGNPRANDGELRTNVSNPQTDDGQVPTDDGVEREDKDNNLSLTPPIVPPTPDGAGGAETADKLLTDGEREKLVALMGEELLSVYVANMSAYIRDGGRVRNPCAMIEKFWREDAKKKSGAPAKKSGAPPGRKKRDRIFGGGSFDTDEFFEAALARSYRGKNAT